MTEPVTYESWMTEEAVSFDKLEGGIHLVSTSSSSHSSHNNQGEGFKAVEFLQENLPTNANDGAFTSKSCDDLTNDQPSTKALFVRSQSCASITGVPRKLSYDHVQSKVKLYIESNGTAQHATPKQSQSTTQSFSKEEYLEEINNRLIRELEEKNTTLMQLQENYEHLLLKYAEAQNKIDNLRFKASAQLEESPNKSTLSKKKIMCIPYGNKSSECQKAIVAPYSKIECMESKIVEIKVDRPSSLAVETSLRTFDKEGLKAVTPTDSEGVSSVITSMSGHSKILTNLDDRDAEQNKKTILKTDVLEKNIDVPVNDPFDKVKNWQNSLPPLDMIETPEQCLYDVEHSDPITSLSTRYNELPVPDLENIPETPEWVNPVTGTISQSSMKKYLRTLSLPSSLTRRNMMSQIYKRRNNHTIDASSPIRSDLSPLRPVLEPQKNAGPSAELEVFSSNENCNILLRRKKRPPFMRSSSLPVYDFETPRSAIRCYVPPLDLDNLTLSEDDTSPISKSHMLSSPSFFTSHDCSFQTLNSLNSCKATASDYSPSSQPRCRNQALHKSTSITPDRKGASLSDKARANFCNVCGEEVLSMKSASFNGIHMSSKDGSPLSKVPIYRSFSFNTETASPAIPFSSFNSFDPDSFDAFANNLKTRSQITMKALTAHVNKT